jgi:serine/threonine protein kinase
MAIEAGQQLLHYRLIEKIGEGGMGVVWKAEDTKLHRHIALKVLPEAMAGDPEYVVPTEGTWHVHNGGWSPDSKKLVYTHDQDYGDIYELVKKE